MCQFECNVRLCAEELLPCDSPLDIQVAHSLVWLSLVDLSAVPDHLCEVAAVWAPAIPRFTSVYIGHIKRHRCTMQHLFYISESLRLPGYPLAPCITSTEVDRTASQPTVPGYHTLSMTG